MLARRAPARTVRGWIAGSVLSGSKSREAGVVAAISREGARNLRTGRGTRVVAESKCARVVFGWVAGGWIVAVRVAGGGD